MLSVQLLSGEPPEPNPREVNTACRHMASLGHNDLTHWPLGNLNDILDM